MFEIVESESAEPTIKTPFGTFFLGRMEDRQRMTFDLAEFALPHSPTLFWVEVAFGNGLILGSVYDKKQDKAMGRLVRHDTGNLIWKDYTWRTRKAMQDEAGAIANGYVQMRKKIGLSPIPTESKLAEKKGKRS